MGDEPNEPDSRTTEMLVGAMELVDSCAPLITAMVALYERYVAEGFTPTAAEAMTVEMHRFYIRKMAHDAGHDRTIGAPS